ncbi:MAG: hypothetical protein HOL01_02015 [Planctomycetaceae bacterium]|mgnify:CR=1 FL=1|nr:hypothetical protein [Planctomycetaceae bacterium]MBT6484604.1 hypothetical protein [Planctomycetaceae bacterium]MBT6493304.1 hypothetical protein [Planctomycetaceae bacterium]
MTEPKPSRRRWKIALGVVVLFAVVGWLVAYPAYQRHRAIEEIERLGGAVYYRETGPQWLSRWGINFERVEAVDLRYTVKTGGGYKATDNTLQYVSSLTSVESLYLGGADITDDGLRHLTGLTNLQQLILNDTQISDHGLKHLRGLTSLQLLWLSNTNVTGKGLKCLIALKQLRELEIDSPQITDDEVESLQQALPNVVINFVTLYSP